MTLQQTSMGIPPIQHKRYGWKPDLPDSRDRAFNAKAAFRKNKVAPKVPSKVDLRLGTSTQATILPPIYDQYALGGCTGNAIAAAFAAEHNRQGLVPYTPSRLFIYYGERELENSIPWDDGAYIRDGMKVINKLGAPDEKLWPYNISQFASKPAQAAYDDGLKHKTISYGRVQTGSQVHVKQALATQTLVVFGFTVYPWFEAIGPDGVAKVPTGNDQGNILGGHAVCLVGYETLKQTKSHRVYGIVRNSWGTSWGDQGYCYIPLTWICVGWNADDFWAIQEVQAA